jgi:NitT/TauT family transport system substrate-binding protein
VRHPSLFVTAVIAAAIVLAGSGVWFSLHTPVVPSKQKDLVRVGTPPVEASALFFIAEDQHYFAKNGINVTIREYEPAITAVQGLLSGEVDIAGTSEYAVVVMAFRNENISILVNGVEVQTNYIVARTDRGIHSIPELRGKRIGIPLETNVEFYLSRFLSLHGMQLSDVSLMDIRPDQFESAITGEGIDAIICWQPYVDHIKQQQGANVLIWPAQNSQPTYGVVIGRGSWVTRNPDLVQRFLKSLEMAEQCTIDRPDEAEAIVQRHLHLSDAYMKSVWPENRFSLTLSQSLVLAMEDEARWMIANNLTNATSIPDFDRYLYPGGLEAIRPSAVNIIR